MKTTTSKQVERAAKRAALNHINAMRAADNFPPLRRIEKLWWSMHGADWTAKQSTKGNL